ncbi:hypothetical protein [Myceligenerans xiligouense]|uniref:Secreted protein n=1 Tax=Myceligenerans xiligouense TaxID=253184 RepID=A0A3N4ZTP1_9MICO|nr:hypothetical protein [Myceligenerans xiligouense]RPF23121.1 hypothetical protein EDD34_3802 [Myceligenerans xiligouense]
MKNAGRNVSPRVVTAVGAGLALALLAGGAGAAAASPAGPETATGGAGPAAGPGGGPVPSGHFERLPADGGSVTSSDDFFVLVPGHSRRGLPPGVELDDSGATVAGGAWTPVEGLLYVVTLGSSTCPRIAEPVASDTTAGAGLGADDELGDIDVTISGPEPGAVCTADWVPTTTVVAAPDGADHGETVSLRIGGLGKTDLLPRPESGAVGPPAWIRADR